MNAIVKLICFSQQIMIVILAPQNPSLSADTDHHTVNSCSHRASLVWRVAVRAAVSVIYGLVVVASFVVGCGLGGWDVLMVGTEGQRCWTA